MRVDFQPCKTRETAWDPEKDAHVSMNVRLDGCIVPTEQGDVGARVSYSHVVVLDDFVDERSRLQLLHHLSESMDDGEIRLRGDVWDRKTLDMDGACPTWGVKNDVIQTLQDASLDGVLEIQSRLVKLYPEYQIVFMPSDAIQEPGQGGNCSNILVNAASVEDTYVYHQDADPTSFPSSSPWVQQYGEYFNGESNKPLLVSLLIYLNSEWRRDWAADTLILDAAGADTGVFIRPRPGRAVLMHQDCVHRMSPPSSIAKGKPRFSIVWKLAFIPKDHSEGPGISRPEWGPPVSFGSASKIQTVLRKIRADSNVT